MLASSSVTAHVPCARVSRSSFSGNALKAAVPRRQAQVLRRAAVAEEAAAATFTPPKLDPSWPSPIFGGSTGGLLRKAQVGEAFKLFCFSIALESLLMSGLGEPFFGLPFRGESVI